MRFQNLARHTDIGSNCYLLEIAGLKLVLDAGTHPKHNGNDTLPLFSKLPPDSVDAVIVSHPHLDHIGALPCLTEMQPGAEIFMTEGTKQAGRALLHNSVNVMIALARELDEPLYPLYSHRLIDNQYKSWSVQPLRTPFPVGRTGDLTCEYFHAGHVLGAVGALFQHENRTVFYTGDVHFENQTLTKGAVFPEEPVDTLIIESTRGDSIRRPDYTRESEKLAMGKVIAETIANGGAVLIPVFAFGKSQEVILMLKELIDQGEIPPCPVHIGGLSSKMTAISDDHVDREERLHRDYRILREFPDLRVMPKGRAEPDYRPGHIYALSSGMMTEKTVSHRFCKHILTSPNDALIFVGYADPESPAGRIQATKRGDKVVMDSAGGKTLPVRCRVERFDFSGHAPREHIVDYAVSLKPERVVLVHGDEVAKQWLFEELQKRLPQSEVVIPLPGERVDL